MSDMSFTKKKVKQRTLHGHFDLTQKCSFSTFVQYSLLNKAPESLVIRVLGHQKQEKSLKKTDGVNLEKDYFSLV